MSNPAVRVAAPGKLMLSGEYAVAIGDWPCLAVAVGCVAAGTMPPTASRVEIAIDAFGTTFSWCPGEPAHGISGFAARAFATAADEGWHLDRRLHLRLRGDVGGRKLGLGTSAATTIAVLRAAARCSGLTPPPLLLADLARRSHAAAQGGLGSGYDVATIAAGGCVRYRMGDQAAQLGWPSGLFAAVLWTGEPADTRASLALPPAAADPDLRAVGAASEALISPWQAGDSEAVLGGLRDCQRAFDAMARTRDGWLPVHVVAALEAISASGCVGRTSGAAGGDCVLGFATDPAQTSDLATRWQATGGHLVATLPQDLAPESS